MNGFGEMVLAKWTNLVKYFGEMSFGQMDEFGEMVDFGETILAK